jgi:hypothetical protein
MNDTIIVELGMKEFLETIFLVLQAILFGHEFHEFSRSNSLKFVKIRVIRVKRISLAAPKK